VEKELDHEKFLDLLEEVEIHVIDMVIRILTRKNPDRAGLAKKLLNPLRTQVRAARFGTPPDYDQRSAAIHRGTFPFKLEGRPSSIREEKVASWEPRMHDRGEMTNA